MNYLNRELSWIDFNKRVLEEGLRKDLPPLERFRFLSIVSSNFDEFFMVRMAALKRALKPEFRYPGISLTPDIKPEGFSSLAELRKKVAEKARGLMETLYVCLEKEIFPALSEGGLEFRRPPYSVEESEYLKRLFLKDTLPVLTPLRVEKKLPTVTNGILHGAFLLAPLVPQADAEPGVPAGDLISIVEIPPVLDRIVWLPSPAEGRASWALLDDLLLKWGGVLFPGHEVKESMLFRVHRDADFSVDEQRDEDFVEAMEEVITGREYSQPVRMAYSPGSVRLKEELARLLELEELDLNRLDGPLNLGSLWNLTQVRGFEQLKAKPRRSFPHPAFAGDNPVWDSIRSADVLLALPYHSFDPVVRFFQEAAIDPQVISIKTALYRTSGNSPLVRALEQAALNGKHVTAVVELKARFDEERNIVWANRLEKAGVIVIYGLARLKVHAKISQVIRREPGGLARYIHLSTGNYNDKTAKFYSDLSFFTAREDFGADATAFFNMLTGYSAPQPLRALIIAPVLLKQRLLELIDRETKRSNQGAPGRIAAKMNALLDKDVIDALYRASRAGVKIQLNIRGACTLIPGVPGLSENIRVVSIVGHYLEHSRILYFNNGGAEEFYISSADWMPRNLERRVELLIPLLDEGIQEKLRDILEAYFKDNTQAWELKSGGEWERITPNGEKPFRAQDYLFSQAEKETEKPWKSKQEFIVRRSPPPGA